MKKASLSFFIIMSALRLMAGGEPSTYFNIYLPPNNDPTHRHVALIITAIYDSTSFEIIDDDMDGDSDDSHSGMLMAGQSYILYIKDNGINDDSDWSAPGEQKADGDYFIVNSDKLVYASQSTDSDWQHDWVPATNKTSKGEKFIIYAPKMSYSNRDLNVFAYDEATTVTVRRISSSAILETGYTAVDINARDIVIQKIINPGQDIIYAGDEGRDILESGHTYIVESNKPVTVQYGALFQNARDGGGYVPGSAGGSADDLFYFAVPYQTDTEQEIRVISLDDNNDVTLERYLNGTWLPLKNWSLNKKVAAEWVGKQEGNVTYPTVFRITCTEGKRVVVLEANWMETGSPGTSDMATMATSMTGNSSGKEFLVYMAPPGYENNVTDPFTGKKLDSGSHAYLFASNKATIVTVKDANTNGQQINRTYTIEPGRYADCNLNLSEWQSIYNGDGNPDSGTERPYLIIESTENIAVLVTNFNDNWMNYFGSSLSHSFKQSSVNTTPQGSPGDTLYLESSIQVTEMTVVEDPSIQVNISSGVVPLESQLVNNSNGISYDGEIAISETSSNITYSDLPDIDPKDDYILKTSVKLSSSHNNGDAIEAGTVISVETTITGEVEGQTQQSTVTYGISNDTDDTSNLMFSSCGDELLTSETTDSWNGAWMDINNDGYEDILVTTKDEGSSNSIYINNGNGSFGHQSGQSGIFEKGKTVAGVWADINNDGYQDVFIVNATEKKSFLVLNKGNGDLEVLKNSGINVHPQYFHGASFADFNNDGYVDLLVTNFFPTRFHHLYRNNGDLTFSKVEESEVSSISERSMAPILGDYDNDGLVDIFIPNGNDRSNTLLRNIGSFHFEPVVEGAVVSTKNNSVGAAWGDFDNDGFEDLFVANASGQNNELYKNNGDGSFSPMTNSIVANDGGHSHGASWVDVDNDADLDLFVTNDQGANFLYINDGTGSFIRNYEELISANTGNSYGAIWADYDKDGAQDVLVFTHGDDTNRLFCNNGNKYNWINLKLAGVKSNRSALGARIELKSNNKWQYRSILPVSGFGSQSSMWAHFGLANATTVDSLVIHWPGGNKQILTNLDVNIFKTILEEESAIVTGAAFHDQNNNGIRDINEMVLGNIELSLSPSNQSFSTNGYGAYSLHLAEGNYHLILSDSINWQLNRDLTFQILDDERIQLDVPLSSRNEGHDLTVDVSTTAWRRGFTNQTKAIISNSGTNTAKSVLMEIHYPQQVAILNGNGNFEKSDTTYSWTIDSILPGETVVINIKDSVSLEAYTGQLLNLSAHVMAEGVDLDVENNTMFSEIEVVGAIDPNDILVSPKGEGPEGYIKNDQWLTYTIRFQNEGTFDATYVTIENDLSANLDSQTFQILSASHNYYYSLENNRLTFKFDHIGLPPKEINEEESMGFVKYRIQPKSHLAGGEVIENNANIIFDYEAPIQTNTVIHTIKYKKNRTVKTLNLAPNPAIESTRIWLDKEYYKFNESSFITTIFIRDSRGIVVFERSGLRLHEVEVPLANLTKGLYIIEAWDNKNSMYIGKLLKK